MTKLISILLLSLTLSGCGSIHLFQKKTPDLTTQPSIEEIEALREGVDYVVPNVVGEEPIKVVKAVSRFVGPPVDTDVAPAKIVKALDKGHERIAEVAVQQNEFFEKYQGKPIEGTGAKITWPWWLTPVLVVGGILLLGGGPLLLQLFLKLRATARTLTQVVKGVDSFSEAHPEVAETLKQEHLAVSMDQASKKQVALTKVELP